MSNIYLATRRCETRCMRGDKSCVRRRSLTARLVVLNTSHPMRLSLNMPLRAVVRARTQLFVTAFAAALTSVCLPSCSDSASTPAVSTAALNLSGVIGSTPQVGPLQGTVEGIMPVTFLAPTQLRPGAALCHSDWIYAATRRKQPWQRDHSRQRRARGISHGCADFPKSAGARPARCLEY